MFQASVGGYIGLSFTVVLKSLTSTFPVHFLDLRKRRQYNKNMQFFCWSTHLRHYIFPFQTYSMAGRRALKAVLIDLSGTLHVEDTAVPGAQDALNR